MLRRDAATRRWVVAGLICYGIALAIVLLSPVSYGGIVSAIGDWLADTFGLDWFGSGWIEFSANLLVFAPLGLLLVLLLGRLVSGVLLAVALSAGAELIQSVIPDREPALRDVLANTLGALLGAAMANLVLRRRTHRDRQGSGSPHPLDQALPESDGVVETRPTVEDPGD